MGVFFQAKIQVKIWVKMFHYHNDEDDCWHFSWSHFCPLISISVWQFYHSLAMLKQDGQRHDKRPKEAANKKWNERKAIFVSTFFHFPFLFQPLLQVNQDWTNKIFIISSYFLVESDNLWIIIVRFHFAFLHVVHLMTFQVHPSFSLPSSTNERLEYY